LNENIEWHCLQLELNWNSIEIQFNLFELNQLDSTIGLKFNKWKMRCKFVKRVWRHKYEKTLFHASLLGNG
jgi:hypothetical protein